MDTFIVTWSVDSNERRLQISDVECGQHCVGSKWSVSIECTLPWGSWLGVDTSEIKTGVAWLQVVDFREERRRLLVAFGLKQAPRCFVSAKTSRDERVLVHYGL